MYQLSKSSYLKGVQCPKALYLDRFHAELKDPLPEPRQALFDKGRLIGHYAQQLFPGGKDASEGETFEVDKAIMNIRKLIQAGEKVIFEAAFEYDEVICLMDVLVQEDDGWKAYEVKGSTNLKNYHLEDTALKYYVITGSGLKLKDISVVTLNNQYVRQGEIEPGKLFKTESVLEKILKKQKQVAENIERLKAVLLSGAIPLKDIGPWCSDPYECDFRGHCWKHIPENSVFDIGHLSGRRKFELYEQGIVSFEDIPGDHPLSAKQRMQIEAAVNKTISRDAGAIREFLQGLQYPLYFLDFESFQPPIPLYDGSRPYQQIPFQYSLHVIRKEGQPAEHYEFLADGASDPRPAFAESLISRLEESGSIVVYNQSFENSILKKLAADFPEYREPVSKLFKRVIDLMVLSGKDIITHRKCRVLTPSKRYCRRLYPN
ncbi:MAG: DUF2779 domain-containing protein [Bacteroidales bacterium]|nr:DUF2779 domain-containing protein [Bacteroidales bacterium]MCF8344618.1 DUF2779 domain-containing protein [Bacteroidales bacterium]MCF8352674.1 DUF2779 domain-containing protein [Bacteroidales bacterium]MCF8377919.1 DUF2779 domain-containing protein [Bacteroidales bacterium]